MPRAASSSGGVDVRLQRVAAEREDRIVLEQELVLSERARGARIGQRPLQRPGLPVGDPAQPAGAQEPGRRLLLHDHALHVLTIPAGCARAIRLAHGRAATRAIPGRSIGRGLLDRLEHEQARLEVTPCRRLRPRGDDQDFARIRSSPPRSTAFRAAIELSPGGQAVTR